MGFTLDPNTGFPTYNNDITDPTGQFQEAVNYARRVGQLTFPTYAALDAYPYASPGLTAEVTGEGMYYAYVSDAARWRPLAYGRAPYIEDTRTANMLVGPGVDHNVITVLVPTPGRWLVEAQATFEANGAGTRRSLLKLDGKVVTTQGVAPSSSSGAGMHISDIVTVPRAGATLAFNVYQTSGAILNILADAALWKIAIRAQYLTAV